MLEVIFRTLLAALVVGTYIWLLTVADGVTTHRIAAIGLPRAAGWQKQFVIGCAFGLGLTLLAVAPLAIWGDARVNVHLGVRALARAAVVVLVVLVGALAEEMMFRGYPFQHLMEGIGATGAIVVFSILFGMVHLSNPGASVWGLINTVLIGILLAVAYLRTRALWLPWGIHFGWNLTLGLLLGLPVSGLRIFNVLVRTSATGPRWATGGSYGVEASMSGGIAVLVDLRCCGSCLSSGWSCRRPTTKGRLGVKALRHPTLISGNPEWAYNLGNSGVPMNRHPFPLLASAILLLTLPLFADDAKSKQPADKITPQTRMLIVRDLTAERVFTRILVPMGTKGLRIKDGKLTPDEQGVAKLVADNGAAARPGDRVIITNVVIGKSPLSSKSMVAPRRRRSGISTCRSACGGNMPTPSAELPRAWKPRDRWSHSNSISTFLT